MAEQPRSREAARSAPMSFLGWPARCDDLVVDPSVRLLHTVAKLYRRCPTELLSNECVVAAAAAHSLGRRQVVPSRETDAGDFFDDVDQLVDGDELVTADVDGLADVAPHERTGPV